MNYIFTDQVLQLLKVLLKDTYELKIQYCKNASIDALAAYYNHLIRTFNEIENKLPNDFKTQSLLSRHVGFINTYLKKGQPENCINDVELIINEDIDVFELDYINYINNRFIDNNLTENIRGLINSKEFESAIRTASLTLTTRLREKFKISESRDGKELVNDIFGQKGITANTISKDIRESLRDFLSGVYGLIRNDYMHKLKKTNSVEFMFIIYILNFALLKIEEIKVG